MTSNPMELLKARVASGDVRISDALTKVLPKFRGVVSDDTLIWCSNELQGYPNALDYYQRKYTDLPPYRVVNGILRVVRVDGQMGDINHPLAARSQHFLSAPIGWIEDFYSLPGELTVVDLPELTNYIGRHQSGGTIVCQCTKTQLRRITNSVRDSLILLIDQVLSGNTQTGTHVQQARPPWISTPGNPIAPQAPQPATPATPAPAAAPQVSSASIDPLAALSKDEFRVSPPKPSQPRQPGAPPQPAAVPAYMPPAQPQPQPTDVPDYAPPPPPPRPAQPLPDAVPDYAPPPPPPRPAQPLPDAVPDYAPPPPPPPQPAAAPAYAPPQQPPQPAAAPAYAPPPQPAAAPAYAPPPQPPQPAAAPAYAPPPQPLPETAEDSSAPAAEGELFSAFFSPSKPSSSEVSSSQSASNDPFFMGDVADDEFGTDDFSDEMGDEVITAPAKETGFNPADAAKLVDLYAADTASGEPPPTPEQILYQKMRPPRVDKGAFTQSDPFAALNQSQSGTFGTSQGPPSVFDQFANQPPDQFSTIPPANRQPPGQAPNQFDTMPPTQMPNQPQFQGTNQVSPVPSGAPGAPPSGMTPTQEIAYSHGQRLKMKSMDLMKQAYLAKDWVIPTWTFSLGGNQEERDFNKAVLNNLLSNNWARAGNAPNVFLLTDLGAKEVEAMMR